MKYKTLLLVGFFSLITCNYSCGSSKDKAGHVQNSNVGKPYLNHLGNSGRISSNHYSDVVLDSKGNAYIANFSTKEDGLDYIKIIKVKTNGDIDWIIGDKTIGRATAISINSADEIFVTGFFSNTFQCGSKRLLPNGPENMFIVKIDAEGQCNWAYTSQYGSKAFDINVNNQGELLVAGVLADKEQFGDVKVTKDDGHNQFIARFDKNGNCEWVKQMNANVRRIKSDHQGRFYVCGGYSEHLFEGDKSYTTTSSYDHDGFVMQVDKKINWVKVFGAPGVINYGYRTYDVIADIAIDKANNLWALSTEENAIVDSATTSIITGKLLRIDPNGNQFDSITIVSSIARGAVSTLLLGDSSFTVTGSEYRLEKLKVISNGFIRTFDYDGVVKTDLPVSNESTFMIRSSYSNATGTVFTGHFRTQLSIDSLEIVNDGNQGLFIYRP